MTTEEHRALYGTPRTMATRRRYVCVRLTPKQHENLMRWANGDPGAVSDDEAKALVRYTIGERGG